ncbi:sugar kinase [Streptomyces sp. IBSBF 2953]|uniref:sugar kinase n=1 Tax=Streptomyces TaxID=1883 RepID=UPI00211A4801|nr:sugar kinase [Streptomyces scabiei]MCQ9182129.1 sugar kinase [Streptomyces hayashii]MDX3118209.1 sugar kinase [Streptomyces scabiei]
MTPSLPHQGASPDEPPRSPEDHRHVIRRRAITLLIIVLLIGVPAGYLVISANQSRDSGKDKEAKYSATGLTAGWPSKIQRRLYQVPIPHPSNQVAYYETNNWKTSRLYVQFQTTHAGLDEFLEHIGVSRADLKKGDIAISGRDQQITGWKFAGPGSRPGDYFGLVRGQKNPAPTLDVVVNTGNATYPFVYVVSRTVP